MTETTSDTSALFGTDDFFQRDNYAPVADELTEFDLPVEGADPGRTRRLVSAQRAQSAHGAPRTGSPATA